MTYRARVLEVQRGVNDVPVGFKETTIDMNAPIVQSYDPFETLLEREGSSFPMKLHEALVAKPDALNMLRDGIRFLAFSTLAQMPRTWNMVARQQPSDKPEEEYLRDASFGVIPKRPSGTPVEFVNSNFEGGVKVTNDLYRVGVMVSGDDIKFDRLGKVRQIATELGRAAAMTEEDAFYKAVTTTANYTRNSTTDDNTVGANQQTLTFSPTNFNTAMGIIGTARDRKGGSFLGYKADTILSVPLMEAFLKQFLMSPNAMRAHADADGDTTEVYGVGTSNPFRGLINRIIISPWMGSGYEWALTDSTVFSYVWQTVEGWNILQDSQDGTSESWLINDGIRYVIKGHFGSGFVDDRAWFFSDSSTAPAST